MFKKRFIAYIVDFLILSFCFFVVSIFIPVNDSVTNLNNELLGINNAFLEGTIDISSFIHQYSVVSYSIDRYMFLSTLISVALSVLYFVVFPLYNNGQSIGKRVLGLKIVNKDSSDICANSLLVRYLFMDGIGVSILSMCLIFVLKDFSYMASVSILMILQFIVVISSVFMIIYRRDFRSLPDLIAGTKVIEVKK